MFLPSCVARRHVTPVAFAHVSDKALLLNSTLRLRAGLIPPFSVSEREEPGAIWDKLRLLYHHTLPTPLTAKASHCGTPDTKRKRFPPRPLKLRSVALTASCSVAGHRRGGSPPPPPSPGLRHLLSSDLPVAMTTVVQSGELVFEFASNGMDEINQRTSGQCWSWVGAGHCDFSEGAVERGL
ncbi:hypothetical protein SKAU_G00375160 [Synaphobranchus kaupii]|uniref:Transcription factor Elf N-terminal domain-containing protein n=1 Tax=Synaphobranchus kaupii TaxID=118154 RepID=A0A9Q1IFE1_SYNKA|nr:hypothetical protein SKAU_G00375160 [Synaphobranchus kaupii]